MTDFVEFPKMARFSREIIVTEKIDGTNAQVWISDDGTEIRAGSRSRWITPADDNYGFAGWVERNRDELLTLGPGRHFGEWWGHGIQRKYGMSEKRFSLFNVSRWGDERPACCHVVPVLYRGDFNQDAIEAALEHLRTSGSIAAPGFTNPEGVVVFHTAGNVGFKKTLHKDELPKSLASVAA
ncbi:MAG TPA: RNA ligase family protein [Phenylobacterium sp.]